MLSVLIVPCVHTGSALHCRFGYPTAFGGHFEAVAPGYLRPLSGTGSKSSTGVCYIWSFIECVSVFPQAAVMDLVDSDKQRGLAVPVWDAYRHLLYQAGSPVRHPEIETSIKSQKKSLCSLDLWLLCVHISVHIESSRDGGEVCFLWTSQESICCCSNRVCIFYAGFWMVKQRLLFSVHKIRTKTCVWVVCPSHVFFSGKQLCTVTWSWRRGSFPLSSYSDTQKSV